MATSGWFVEPDTVRKELSDGQWIEIKTRLTYGEQKRLETGARDGQTVGQYRRGRGHQPGL
jgi:hypothetical protein